MFETEKRMRCLEAAVAFVNGLLANHARKEDVKAVDAVLSSADIFLKYVNSGDVGLPNQGPEA